MKRFIFIVLVVFTRLRSAAAVELLVIAADPKDLKITPFVWSAGDVVVAKPDGWRWGKAEGPPRFYVLKIPGATVADAKTLLDEKTDPVDVKKTIGRRVKQFDLSKLTAAEKLQADAGVGPVTLSKTVVEITKDKQDAVVKP